MGNRGSNEERLREAGVINPEVEELPLPYLRAIEGLSKKEVDLLIALRKRVEAADEWQGMMEPAPPERTVTSAVVFGPVH